MVAARETIMACIYAAQGAELVLERTGPITWETIVRATIIFSHWLQVVFIIVLLPYKYTAK